MDTLAIGAAVSVLFAVLAFAVAFFSNATAGTLIRGRLEGALSGTGSVLEGAALTPLRGSKKRLGPLELPGAWLKRLERDLQLTDSHLEPADVIALRISLAGLGVAVPYLLIGGVLGILAGLAAAVVGFQVPMVWLGNRRAARKRKLEHQLPEALTFVANSLKSGFGLLQSLSMAADQLEHPIATELAQTVHETNVGSSSEDAFIALGERCNSNDMELVVTAVLIQRSAGGNLAEILETVAETMRERVRIRGEIATLTAQQSLTGFVIALMPVFVGGLFLVVSPDYIMVLFTKTMGQVMLGAAVFLEMVGILVIRRILAIEV